MINTDIKTLIILFLASCCLTLCFKFYAVKKQLLDFPNERSSHELPTPRGAGVVFVGLWFLYVLYDYSLGNLGFSHLILFVLGPFLVALAGFLDDHQHTSIPKRFIVYLIASVIGVVFLTGISSLMIGQYLIHLGFFGSILATLAIFWSLNLYNFMDGIDGLAGLEAIFIFGVGGYLLWRAGGHELAQLAWALAALVLGFFVWNFPKAQVFMGDVGSVFLGFLIGIFALAGEKWYHVPAVFWLMLYGVFVFDATVTVIRRVIAGKKWYGAHRLHAYQRMQLHGWGHRKILSAVFLINLVIGAIVIWIDRYRSNLVFAALFLEIIILMTTYLVVEKLQPMFGIKEIQE